MPVMSISDTLLDPGLHPAQILQALKGFVDALKARCGLPVRVTPLEELAVAYEQGRWAPNGDQWKSFGLVCNAYIPCRIHVVPDYPRPWVKVDVTLFDAYYGPGSCYRALNAYVQLLSTAPKRGHRADAPSEEQETDGLHDVMAAPEAAAAAAQRRGAKAAQKRAVKSGHGAEIMNDIAMLEQIVKASTVTSRPSDGLATPEEMAEEQAAARKHFNLDAVLAAMAPPKPTEEERFAAALVPPVVQPRPAAPAAPAREPVVPMYFSSADFAAVANTATPEEQTDGVLPDFSSLFDGGE